ncbi:MAG: metal dependent phosphohydrolase [Anaerocolumna sp.]|jgi:HD superfamily phosphodiesterase|nr:metal dependent phosphohydrolase [Anaerocolumna sp.]
MNKIGDVIQAMIEYYSGDIKRINHFLKVYGFAKVIGEAEGIECNIQELLEVAALVHDIGIKISEEKYNSSSGYYQQIEGPEIAKDMLQRLGYEKEFIERVCYLIAHHHTYHNIDGIDSQILVEADFIVNIYEDNMESKEIKTVEQKIFKTKSGISILHNCYYK